MINPQSSSKKRVLSVFSLVMINVVAIDSLRNLPANAANGLSIPFYYLVACIIFMIPCALVTAELATHYPKTGGSYVWVRKAFGPRWGFTAIWLQWVYNVFWYPTILAFIAANVAYLINPSLAQNKVFMVSIVLSLFTLSTIANCYGMKLSGWISDISAILGCILPMILITVLGIVWIAIGKPLAISPTIDNFIPNIAQQHNLAFLVVVFFSLFGLEMSAVHAEEVKHPKKNYPKALLYSCVIIALTLTLSSTAIAIVVPHASLDIVSGLDQALSIFLKTLHLGGLFPIALLCIIIGGFGNMSAWVIGPTKGLVVAAEEGHMPELFKYRNQKGAPVAILIFQAIIVGLISCLFFFIKSFNTSYWILSDLTAQLALLFYLFLFSSAICLRFKRKKETPEAFTIPGKNYIMVICAGIGILSCLFAIAISFIPPDNIQIKSTLVYESILIGGILLFSLPPMLFCQFHKKTKK
jgi:amino acid transporter